ncbi:prepilin peptidase [Nitriliruptor alkaliphilus]|uniref:prepilin peptidase n=1 Tax=Nitriliruptor alkaliphilus TaxID=427918 RepID=UPI0024817298|nr:A24 family peptidase [Nitriliruptor alkaliphilus]
MGSFANVPIHRWPRQGTVTEPKRSACPSCGTLIAARDNVPVVSWLVLRGRCRTCGEAISPRYLVVEVITAVLFAGVAWIWWEQPVLLLTFLVFTWSLVVATAIDLEHRIIPNRLTYRLPFVLLPLLIAHALLTDTLTDLRRGVIAGLAIPFGMFLLSELFRLLRGQSGMGMGDVKLAVSLGLVVGYLGGIQLVAFAYGTIISAVVVAFGLIAVGRAKLASRIPFGPYLAIGAMLPVLAPQGTERVVRSVLGL